MRSKVYMKEYNRIWRLTNKEKVKAYRKTYLSTHSQYSPKVYERMKRWRLKNSRYFKAYQAAYQRKYIKKYRERYFKLHPDKLVEFKQKRRESALRFYRENRELCNYKRKLARRRQVKRERIQNGK